MRSSGSARPQLTQTVFKCMALSSEGYNCCWNMLCISEPKEALLGCCQLRAACATDLAQQQQQKL
jgi:hypothetical protein